MIIRKFYYHYHEWKDEVINESNDLLDAFGLVANELQWNTSYRLRRTIIITDGRLIRIILYNEGSWNDVLELVFWMGATYSDRVRDKNIERGFL
jgi:hypothetical protein